MIDSDLTRRMMRATIRLSHPILPAVGLLLLTSVAAAQSRQQLERARLQLVQNDIVAAGVKNERVLKAMRETERHEFVPFALRDQAYLDMSLPIGAQQTISSPFIVAFMTESLDPQPTDKVLEIGTGSGYQAAVLSPLVREVYTIEIVPSLGNQATRTLKRLRYQNVFVKVGDGYQGWPEHAPFDKIIVTCSPEKIPQPLVDQLAEGGLMVIPVGQRYQQTLTLMRKRNGKLESEALRPTLFVPMTGVAEQSREVKPDPADPQVVNGNFEDAPDPENGFISGWYYQRHAQWQTDVKAPQGEHFVSFQNEHPGLSAHLLQGFAIDGKAIQSIDLSAWVKTDNVMPGRNAHELPVVVVTFYDSSRKELGNHWLGPFRGSQPWIHQSTSIKVPAVAQEAILRIGLFGATGTAGFDDVQIKSTPR
jgi:protein-L-isoaspartate(D-aspartate) O-methyltransferase